ncbi:MAG: hypothetical protein WCD89_05845 [Anaerocolumna sp.]
MNQQTADELIEEAVKSAIREYGKEQKMERKKKALHNTKMLLKKYHAIKSSIDEVVSDAVQLEQDFFIFDTADELYIESIKRSKLRSLIVIAHIDKALSIVHDKCKLKGVPEKYDAFVSCMLKGMSYDDAAILYLSSKTSISRWINEVTREISIQIFGIDGVDII